ncbi:glycogen/starch synthase [Candidatus Woesearchaeota archaeon]|nr:glycogen/starch synthase [Candidatus Woesearchaeota archaeon]
MDKKADILFEVSWEVCNKVGGIYTVVMSKAAKMVEAYGENYFMIGPYFAPKAIGHFEEEIPNELCKQPFEELKRIGVICHYGKWLVEGSPNVILIDFENCKSRANDIKRELWDWFKIDSLRAPKDYDEPVVWAYTAGMLLEILSKRAAGKKIVAHFHEWLSGTAILYLKKKKVNIGTVFTTHATVLGRALASANADLYSIWDKINPDQEVYKYNIESKHLVERNSAAFADAFTTVSEITGMEALYLLKKKPDILLPNGLDISKFPSFEEIVIKHKIQRDRIREFMLYYFFPYYTFDPKETLIYFLAGRYEFHDKGIDIYIKALGKLNEAMKREKTKKTIVAFIWVPANFRNIKPEIIENKTLFQDIKDALEETMGDVEKNLIYSFVSGKKISNDTLFEEDFLTEMKIRVSRFLKKGTPPAATHDLYSGNDEILGAINAASLKNGESDPVKIIFYPIYLSGADGLLNLNYYEAMQGSHLGIFPSYYEPWGYTPLEAGALGVSSVTTDLAGFGRYFCSECAQSDTPGIYVLKRLNKSDDDVVSQLVEVMLNFANFSKEERTANKLQARKTASMADWKSFIKNYIAAHDLAVEKAYK